MCRIGGAIVSVDFERERCWWDRKAPREQQDLSDEDVNRALRWRQIERHLGEVRTILEVGAATGAFTIPLAKRGFKVTHVDFSPAMLELARQNAAGQDNIEFVQANAVDLSRFADRSFDLVLNMDGAVSFCGTEAERAIRESVRVTRHTIILTVSNLAWMIPSWLKLSLKACGKILPAVREMFEHGHWHYDQFPDNAQFGEYFGTLQAFSPAGLRQILESAGMRVLCCNGLGSLANLTGPETVKAAYADKQVFDEFLALCERFDGEVLRDGPGTMQRAGLIAVAIPAT